MVVFYIVAPRKQYRPVESLEKEANQPQTKDFSWPTLIKFKVKNNNYKDQTKFKELSYIPEQNQNQCKKKKKSEAEN